MSRRVRAGLALLAAVCLAAPARAETFLPEGWDLSRFLPPPPDATASGVEAVLLLERARTRDPARVARARADVDESLGAFATMFGPAVTPLAAPRTFDLFARVTEDAAAAFNRAKAIWRRARPETIARDLHPCVPTPATPSYPSGHAVLGTLYALLLSDMLPEWRDRLHARAREYADGRELCGIHYPSDTRAGEMAAAAIAATFASSEPYATRMRAAGAELRALLGLPSALPVTNAVTAPADASTGSGEDFRVR